MMIQIHSQLHKIEDLMSNTKSIEGNYIDNSCLMNDTLRIIFIKVQLLF